MTDEKIKITKEEAEEFYNSLTQEQKDKMNKLGMLMTQAEFRKKLEQNPKEALKCEGFEIPDNWSIDKNEFHDLNSKWQNMCGNTQLEDGDLVNVAGGADDALSVGYKMFFVWSFPGQVVMNVIINGCIEVNNRTGGNCDKLTLNDQFHSFDPDKRGKRR